jgi:hypothetical protein
MRTGLENPVKGALRRETGEEDATSDVVDERAIECSWCASSAPPTTPRRHPRGQTPMGKGVSGALGHRDSWAAGLPNARNRDIREERWRHGRVATALPAPAGRPTLPIARTVKSAEWPGAVETQRMEGTRERWKEVRARTVRRTFIGSVAPIAADAGRWSLNLRRKLTHKSALWFSRETEMKPK